MIRRSVPLRQLAIVGIATLLFAASLMGQMVALVLSDPDPQANAGFGISVAGVGDLNGDGVPDVAVGANGQDVGVNLNQGEAFVFSGTDGALLRTLINPVPQASAAFGVSVAGVGDVNGDGVPDIAVGANTQDVAAISNQGQAFVFSGVDGALLRTFDNPAAQANAAFGFSVAGVGDVNGDGVPDIAVGAESQDLAGLANQGQAFVFSGADGVLLRTLDNPSPQGSASFGISVAGAGDVNGDSVPDVVVGAERQDVGGLANQGQAFVFSGADGLLLLTLDDPAPELGGRFGIYVTGTGDANGDGTADVAVGARAKNLGGNVDQGQAFVFSGVNGALLRTLDDPDPQANAFFGGSLAGLGDVNGDGEPDVVVGASGQNVGPTAGQGRAFVFSLAAPSRPITASVSPSDPTPAEGSTIASCVRVDMGTSGLSLGSVGLSLEWDTAVLDLQEVGITHADPPFGNSALTFDESGPTGVLRFSAADPNGRAGDVFVLCAPFAVIGAVGSRSALTLSLTSLFSTTLEDFLPQTVVQSGEVLVGQACRFGDVNGDAMIDSGDALMILVHSVGQGGMLPAAAQERIQDGCGDVNRDGATDPTDANIVLTFEVQGPIDPAFPVNQPNVTLDDCRVCLSAPAPRAATLFGAAVREAEPLRAASRVPESGGTITTRLERSLARPRRGEEFEVAVVVDMADSGRRLGSYGASLAWDQRAVEFLGAMGGRTAGFRAPVINGDGAAGGVLRFAHADPDGAAGEVEILRVRFRALRALPRAEKVFDLGFSSLAATGPGFESLAPATLRRRGRPS